MSFRTRPSDRLRNECPFFRQMIEVASGMRAAQTKLPQTQKFLFGFVPNPAYISVVSRDTNSTMEYPNDGLLLERFAKDGSQEAFSALVTRYASMVYATCLRCLGQAEAAEDASQAVFLLLSKNAGRLSAPRTLAPWLHSMSVLVCKGHLSREAKIKKMEQAIGSTQNGSAAKDVTTALMLDEALANLSKRDREAVVMRHLQGLSLDEVAQVLGASPDGARMRVERALGKLRSKLAGSGFFITGSNLPYQLNVPQVHAPAALIEKASSVHAVSHTPRVIAMAKGANILMKKTAFRLAFTKVAIGAGAAAFGIIAYQQLYGPAPFTTTAYHVVSYAVQPAGADRDPKFKAHKITEQWIDRYTQRIKNYDYWQPGESEADYLLSETKSGETVTLRNPRGDIMTISKSQAIAGTAEGKWAQAPQITPLDSDFSKIEHFWKKAVVELLPRRSMTVEGKQYTVVPHQVTENGMFRMTGYIDVQTHRLVRQEEYSKDRVGWYLLGYTEFDYDPLPKIMLAADSLGTTHPFELAMPAKK